MSFQTKENKKKQRRASRVRFKLKNSLVPKISIFRSLNHIYAQIVDMTKGQTVASCSSIELKDVKGSKKEIAHTVGLELAKRAKKQGIETVVFDRGSYLYHGRVKELSQGLRDGGLSV